MIEVVIAINGKEIYRVGARNVSEPCKRKHLGDCHHLLVYRLTDGRTMKHWPREGANVLAARMIECGIGEALDDMLLQHGDNWALSSNERAAAVLGKRWSRAKQRWV